jgi:predicted nucleotidyltransferase
LNGINKHILTTLAYFDMFNYPLNRTELFLFMQQRCGHREFDEALKYMVANQYIFNFGEYYTLNNEPRLRLRRMEGNRLAADFIKIAHKVGNILIRVPYVRGIAISGSLSKNFADENSDIDLFIITAKNRLWIARTLMHCVKKLSFLFNRQHYFCMNYYVDEAQLQIAEKNIYTAIEVVTLMPLHGEAVFEQFFAENSWTQTYLPNNYLRVSAAKPLKNGIGKQLFEVLFNNKLGNAIDKVLMNITASRWNKKTTQKRLNMHGVLLNMYAGRHCSKPNPIEFQHQLLKRYEDKVEKALHVQENSVAY